MSKKPFARDVFSTALARTKEPRRFIQVLAGPRQVGKTTLAQQVVDASGLPAHMVSADEPALRDQGWLRAQWEIGRLRARDSRRGALLVIDEVQKVGGWSETVKRLWDEDTASGVPLRVILLGSAPLLVQGGLTESLAGRFELVRLSHWSFAEMRDAFGWDVETFIHFGGYPGAAPLVRDPERWTRYILDSLVETTLSRDILLLTRVDKPALLRQLFRLACDYSGQILSFQKMVGQLQDAGNTTTLAHYLDLLGQAGMVMGLQKYSGSQVRRRGSSPKLIVLNTALMSAGSGRPPRQMRRDPDAWGRLVESAVGAHILIDTSPEIDVSYWRHRGLEVDFVLERDGERVAIEVTSGRRKDALPGLAAFEKAFGPTRTLLVGGQGISVEEFLLSPATRWFG